MFGWLIGWLKKRPTDKEMRARIMKALDEFIQQHGIEEFSKDRLSVVVEKDFSVKIIESSRAKDALVAVPLKDLIMIQFAPHDSTPTLYLTAIVLAVTRVMERLLLNLQLQSK
jgi:hypothetical protein